MAEKLPPHIEKNILVAEDGYRYYWPDGGGMYSAENLRGIANRLDELNKEWNEKIKKYFEKGVDVGVIELMRDELDEGC